MSLPTPDLPGSAPVWDNYVVAQVVQASLGLIPEHVLAMGVEIAGTQVRLRFQLSMVAQADELDMDDIVSDLEALVGPAVHVDRVVQVVPERDISPSDGVRWIFLARVAPE